MYLTFLLDKEERLTNQEFTLDDIFNGVNFNENRNIQAFNNKKANYITKTIITARNPRSFNREKLQQAYEKLKLLAQNHNPETIMNEYSTFFIPKKTGGMREINAPTEQLMNDLRDMKELFQYDLKVLYHNAAFAYAPRRSIVDALKVHQRNNSKWFLKLDIKNFFPNCTQEFVVNQLRKIYPFNEFTEEQLNDFIWICFRNDSLPQGTPMSPMLTNLIMIPFDYAMQQYAFENHLVYTRYADDILISSYHKWDYTVTMQAINTAFETLNMPFVLKAEKTRFGSSAGRNWNLGLMFNKDNQITVGYKNKKRYKAMLNNLMIAETSGNFWDTNEIYYFQGITSYYKSVEPDYFNKLIEKYENTFNLTLKEIYKRAL